MDQTLHNLALLLIKAIPTIFFFLFLIVYLNAVYFRPMARILEERRKQTEGSRELAKKAFEAADSKSSEFEKALQLAGGEIGQENEKVRRQWELEQAETLAQARADAEAKVAAAKISLADEVEKAKSELDVNVEGLSTSIVEALSGRRAA